MWLVCWLSAYFGESKTKSVLFASNVRSKRLKSFLSISLVFKYDNIPETLTQVIYLTVFRGSKAYKVLSKVNARLKFSSEEIIFKSVLLIMLHLDTASSWLYWATAWYPYLSTKLKNWLNKLAPISQKEFETINCLHIKEWFKPCMHSIVFKYFDNKSPNYLKYAFLKAPKSSFSLRDCYHKLKELFHKTTSKYLIFHQSHFLE